MNAKRLIVMAVIVLLVAAFFAFDLGRFLTLEYLQGVREDAVGVVVDYPVASRLGYFLFYVLVTALSLPGAAVMTLAGGAVFGIVWGMLLVSFASSIGATLAFMVSRVVLGDWVQRRFADELRGINEGLARDGNFYLFGLRMVPLFPFFVINLVMGLTKMRAAPFYLVSQLGMLAGTFVFVFAGTQLAEVRRLEDVLSPGLIVALSLLGLFPLITRKVMAWITSKRSARE